jgi:hypothetical protein
MSFGAANLARARGNHIRHGLLILQQAPLGKSARMVGGELEAREGFSGERLTVVDLGLFALRPTHTDANEDIVF